MNKNKKRLIVLSTCILSSSVLVLPFLPKAGFLSNVTADEGYTCPLPDTYVELDTIISAAYAAGNTPRDNNYKFRGTVVRKEWDVAYIQRVNQVDHYAYALRITGVATFAEHIQVGNVVDFNGGQVYLYQGIPSFAITDNNKTFVRYSVNPTGYGPMVYHTVRDLNNEAYNSSYATIYKDDVETYTYASNRLVQIRNAIPYTYGNLPGDAESRKFYGLRDGYFSEIRVTSVSSVDLESYINEALSGNKTMHVTGMLQIYRVGSSMFPIINIIK